jgi:hypothetical protein
MIMNLFFIINPFDMQDEGPHKENECKIFQMNGIKFPPPHTWPVLYKSILIVRIILLIKVNPSIWSEFFVHLEHHNEVRRKKDHCVKSDKMILENIHYFFLHSGMEIDLEMVHRIIGTVNVNAFGSTKGDNDRENLRSKVRNN